MLSLKHKNFTFDFIYLFLFVFIFNILYLYLISFIYHKPFVDEDDFSKLTITTFLMYVFFIPLLEELCFRGILNINNNVFFITIAISVVLLMFFKFNFFLLFIIVLLIALGTLTLFKKELTLQIKILINNNIIPAIVITTLLFSIAHIKNYETLNNEAWLKLVTRLTGGFYLGYIAYKHGISKSYILHGIHNALPFVIILIVKYFSN